MDAILRDAYIRIIMIEFGNMKKERIIFHLIPNQEISNGQEEIKTHRYIINRNPGPIDWGFFDPLIAEELINHN